MIWAEGCELQQSIDITLLHTDRMNAQTHVAPTTTINAACELNHNLQHLIKSLFLLLALPTALPY